MFEQPGFLLLLLKQYIHPRKLPLFYLDRRAAICSNARLLLDIPFSVNFSAARITNRIAPTWSALVQRSLSSRAQVLFCQVLFAVTLDIRRRAPQMLLAEIRNPCLLRPVAFLALFREQRPLSASTFH